MRFIKIKSNLIFGIILVFLAFAFIGESSLSAQLTEIEGISSEDYSYQGENSEIQGEVMVCKEGFENCKIEITPKGGGSINLELTQGINYDPASGKISVTESGASFKIGDVNFSNIDSGNIILDQKTGEISEAKFTTNSEGGTYDFGVVSFSVESGEVNFNLNERSLILPEESVLEDFDSELFFKKFENEGLIVEGKNLEISEGLSNKIFGNPSEKFKKLSGKIGLGQAKELINIEKGILKKDPDKYFIFVPEEETISFPDVGINIETASKKTFVSFLGNKEVLSDLESMGRPGSYALREENFIIESGGYPGYVSLAEDRVYADSGVFEDKNSVALMFNKNSHYAGFDVGENGHFSFKIDAGSAELSEGKINIVENINPMYWIENDGDAIEKESSGTTLLHFKEGKKGTAPVASGFSVFSKDSGEFLFSMPSRGYYENAKEEKAPLSQIIYFQSKKGLPVYIIDSESRGKVSEFITLPEAYKKRSEVATFYYNSLFEKN